MMTDVKTDTLLAPGPPFGDLEKNWGWLLAFGLFSIILGSIGLGMTFMLTELVVVFFAALLIVGGVCQILDAFKCHGWKSTIWPVLIALLYIGVGVYMTTAAARTACAEQASKAPAQAGRTGTVCRLVQHTGSIHH
ncbi:DUF308 domain-containing protein [Lamprobacter modestohalophilus]|nr:DUF308 domain-containing protein [Lamprobacter modestohalophilus]